MKITVTYDFDKDERLAMAKALNGRTAGLADKQTITRFIDRAVNHALDTAVADQLTGSPASPQRMVYNSVQQRGYTDGYTYGQFLYRQLVKLAEELAEAFKAIDPGFPESEQLNAFLAYVDGIGQDARYIFDQLPAEAFKPRPADIMKLKEELADLQVILYCAAQAFELEYIMPCDIIQLAVSKAKSDEKRGVRSDQ